MSILNKPQKRTNFKVSGVFPYTGMFLVYTSPELATKYMQEFGILTNSDHNAYFLTIDRRYDFEDVEKYLKKIENEESFKNVRS